MKTALPLLGIAVCTLGAASCSSEKKMTSAEYSGEILTGRVEIVRDKQTKTAVFKTDDIGKWQLYAGPCVDSIDFSTPVAEGDGAGEYPLDVPADRRSYFQLVAPHAKAILAETLLPMEGGYNFRDMGGIRTVDGRYVRWGRLFRSDDMPNLTDADLEYLSTIPLRTVVDFRSAEEIAKAPDRLPRSVVNAAALSIDPGSIIELASGDKKPYVAGPFQMMQDLNRLLVSEPAIVEIYKEFFALVQDESKLPLMFHCSAGKDRTGMAAALILSALGVDRQIIIRDYLASNDYLSDKYAPIVAEHPESQALMEVHREYIEAGFDEIERRYGTVSNYLEKQLGVDTGRMKDMFLY